MLPRYARNSRIMTKNWGMFISRYESLEFVVIVIKTK